MDREDDCRREQIDAERRASLERVLSAYWAVRAARGQYAPWDPRMQRPVVASGLVLDRRGLPRVRVKAGRG